MDLASANQYCTEQARASGSSFTLAFHLLQPAQQAAMNALYAYCREVDDIVDEAVNRPVARMKLAWWREEIQRLYAVPQNTAAQHPVTIALQPAIAEFALPQEEFEALLDGMEMDLQMDEDGTGYPDRRSLGLYCHRVAGVVGLLSARIFSYRDPHTLKYAARLGLALQLTNILRDIGEDARRGRLYLPADELAAFGVTPDAVKRRQPDGDWSGFLRRQYAATQRIYDEALALLPAVDRRAQRPGLIMGAIYRSVLDEIHRADYPVLTARVSLPALRKLWIAGRVWLLAR